MTCVGGARYDLGQGEEEEKVEEKEEILSLLVCSQTNQEFQVCRVL